MKQKLLIAAAALAMVATPSFAVAQDSSDGSGWYLKGAAGYGAHTDLDITGQIVGDVESEGNGALNAGLGYDFGESWRLELDGTTMLTDNGAVSQVPSSFAKLRTDAVMLNAIYDFSDFGKFAPYVGAGVGIISADASIASHDFPNVDGTGQITNPTCVGERSGIEGYSCNVDDSDIGVGWQLLAGLGYDITDNLTWDTNYRYLQTSDMDFDSAFTNAATGAATVGQTKLDGVGAHQILTGFRYRFGQSAAPAIVKPAMVEPARVAPTADFKCWDGSMVFNSGECPVEAPAVVEAQPEYTCWDGTMVFTAGECTAQPEVYNCPDGSLVYDKNQCPTTDRSTTIGDLCGETYRQEIIYYEFNKGASAETRNTISRILDAGEFCDIANVRVVGHTDTSGAASYNLALSKRRASDALNELVRQGLDRSKITSEGKGETENFVQTGDGVKEQLNRRTEVLITLGSVGAIN